MKLESLHIYANYDGAIRGNLKVKGRHGEITLTLNDDQCRKVMLPVMGAMVEESKKVAAALTAELEDARNEEEVA